MCVIGKQQTIYLWKLPQWFELSPCLFHTEESYIQLYCIMRIVNMSCQLLYFFSQLKLFCAPIECSILQRKLSIKSGSWWNNAKLCPTVPWLGYNQNQDNMCISYLQYIMMMSWHGNTCSFFCLFEKEMCQAAVVSLHLGPEMWSLYVWFLLLLLLLLVWTNYQLKIKLPIIWYIIFYVLRIIHMDYTLLYLLYF